MKIALAEFGWDRADIDLRLGSGPLDIPMGTAPLNKAGLVVPPPEPLPAEVSVRLAQISTSTQWPAYFARFTPSGPGSTPRSERQNIMREVTSAFEVDPLGAGRGPVLLPEVSIPQEEIGELESLAQRTQRAVVAGTLWRNVPMVVRGRSLPRKAITAGNGTRFLVNEAKVIVPTARVEDPYFSVFRTFTIRKPVPAVEELGLCDALSEFTNIEWRMLRGRTWYRFIHPLWGDFTVAICSDLTDPGPWRSLDGQVLHLFVVSYNKDVNLFEQLTWVRAFELHANVVAVNHGTYGGSFVWSPQHDLAKELARLRGRELSLLADVELPVRDLAAHQSLGAQRARTHAQNGWDGQALGKKSDFKAPRPGFRCRTLR